MRPVDGEDHRRTHRRRHQAPCKWKQSRQIEVECTAFDRPHTWTYLNGGPVAVSSPCGSHPSKRDTAVLAFDAKPRGWFRLVFPIFVRIMRREERANMTRLKNALERRPQTTAPGALPQGSPG